MPVIKVTLIRGYDEATRQSLMQRLTDAVRATIAAPLEAITIALDESEPASYMRGRQSRTPGAPLPSAATVVREYLDAMERRDIATAKSKLHADFQMVFPGDRRMSTLEELIEWSAPRYKTIGKSIESVEECFGPDGMTVYCFGTLQGTWLSGESFSGIRFIDRFTLIDGTIHRQLVWNDLAEYRAAQH
jgi:phenylpyruvate tautomerase PptA (4-oxalocrotonate tautomerase family)